MLAAGFLFPASFLSEFCAWYVFGTKHTIADGYLIRILIHYSAILLCKITIDDWKCVIRIYMQGLTEYALTSENILQKQNYENQPVHEATVKMTS